MIYCPFCGSIVKEDSEFCQNCGAALEEQRSKNYPPPSQSSSLAFSGYSSQSTQGSATSSYRQYPSTTYVTPRKQDDSEVVGSIALVFAILGLIGVLPCIGTLIGLILGGNAKNKGNRNGSIAFGISMFTIIGGLVLIGIILSLFVLKKNVIFPVIFAHALNNVISAHTVWNHIQGNDFMTIALFMYLPLLIISGVLLVWQFPLLKKSLSSCIEDIKQYFENDDAIDETNGDKYFRILMDVVFGFALFLIGILLLI